MLDAPIFSAVNGCRADRHGLKSPRVARVDTPLWTVCRRAHWDHCCEQAWYVPPTTRGVAPGRLRVALHGGVGRLALATCGACRDDLVAIAIDGRALPGAGADTRVRVDLDSQSQVNIWIDVDGLSLGSCGPAVWTELLVSMPDSAGYAEPKWRTIGDAQRSTDRQGLRRTPDAPAARRSRRPQ